MTTSEILKCASDSKYVIAAASTEKKNNALKEMADALIKNADDIITANRIDIKRASGKISPVMIDRLTLDNSRIKSMADGINALISLPDPTSRVLNREKRPNGLIIEKVSVPIGVIALIYESRPNVTSDAAALALKSGNVCVLRGGKEAINSNKAIVSALRCGLENAGLPRETVSLIEDTTHESANELMSAVGLVDLLIPRGGAGLIRACVENAKVPCIETGTGICHIYVNKSADIKMALDIVDNAKTSRPSVCNAAEVCLVDREIAPHFLPLLYKRLTDDKKEKGLNEVEFRPDCEAESIIHCGNIAKDNDFHTEFLDYILAVKVVGGIDEAIEHIRNHSTGHSESIVTKDAVAAEKFVCGIDSAAVYVNASTRFTDGGEFGLGCEMGISTQKIHVRGPMGLMELTSYKYIVRGNGQIR